MAETIIAGIVFYFIYKFIMQMKSPKKTQPITITAPPPPINIELTENKYLFNPAPATNDFMKALIFIARSDGRLTETERNVVIDYLKNAQPEHTESPNHWIHEDIKNLPQIGQNEFKKYLESLDGKTVKLLYHWSKVITENKKTLHAYTEHLMTEIENRVNVAGDDYEVVDGVRMYRLS